MTVFVLVWSLTHYAIPRMFELLLSSSSEDDEANTEKSVVLLGMISVCLSVALLTEVRERPCSRGEEKKEN